MENHGGAGGLIGVDLGIILEGGLALPSFFVIKGVQTLQRDLPSALR